MQLKYSLDVPGKAIQEDTRERSCLWNPQLSEVEKSPQMKGWEIFFFSYHDLLSNAPNNILRHPKVFQLTNISIWFGIGFAARSPGLRNA
jgi:hypothetical protein